MVLEKDKRADYNQELYRRYRDARQTWDNESRYDIDFYHGNHYTSDEVDVLQSRNQADVPMDRIGPAIEKFKAVLTSRSPAFTITPREDSDVKVASLWRTIMGFIWGQSNGDWQLKQAIHDYATTGMGYLYCYIDPESDFGRGDVKFTYVNPFRVYVSPNTRNRWYDDAESIILSTILTGEQVTSLYPELAEQENEETGEMETGIIQDLETYLEEDYPDAMNSNSKKVFTPAETKELEYYERNKYQILERFYKTKVTFYRIIDMQNGEETVLSEPEYAEFVENNREQIEVSQYEVIPVKQTRIKVCASIGQIVLYETILNTDHYPIIPFPNIFTETPYPQSDVSRARPMQRLLNKLWSLAVSHAQASGGLKLLVPLGSVEDLGQLERDWANPNAVIEVDSTQGEPHFPAPQPLASEFYRLIQQCEFYIDFTFGLPEMMHGFSEKAPETVAGTERMIALGTERPKSKLRDLEFSINRVGQVLYNLSKGHYTYKKIFRLFNANNDISEATVNMYDEKIGTMLDIKKERHNLSQHDIRIEPGSTLPTNKWAELGVYMEAFRMGIVDKTEVLKKNPEIFDKESIMRRTEEKALLQRQIQAMEEQIKNLEGDLQTAQRESVSDRKRVEVEKFKSRLQDVAADAKADRRVQLNNLQTKVKLEAEKLANVRKDASSAPEA